MIVDINKIVVRDRIRKDFGDIKELANDIKRNAIRAMRQKKHA